VDRRDLWHALTPQMFPLHLLKNALLDTLERGVMVTDEASAMELQGLHPQLVQGSSDNIKITHPEDLPLAAFYLQQQEGSK
jgi:2-C-methyl-D-erythritol 4-phosphate cytidylyltransferase